MRPPLDECLDVHFPSHAGSSVVGVNKTGGNNEKVIGDVLVIICAQTNPWYSGSSS